MSTPPHPFTIMSSSFSSISQSIHTRLCLILGWTNIANFNSQQRHDQEQGDVIQFHLNNMLLATWAHYGAHFLQPYSSDLINHHQFKLFLDKHGPGRPLFELFCILNVSLLLMRSNMYVTYFLILCITNIEAYPKACWRQHTSRWRCWHVQLSPKYILMRVGGCCHLIFHPPRTLHSLGENCW